MEVFQTSLSGIPLLQIVGDVDHFTAPALEEAAREALALDSGRLLFDLTAVPYLDSGGAGVFLTLDRDMRPGAGWASSEPMPTSFGSSRSWVSRAGHLSASSPAWRTLPRPSRIPTLSATAAQQPGAPRRLTLPPDLSRLPEVRAWAWEAGSGASLSEARIFDLQVTVSEAAANAIEHAASAVELTAWLLPDRLIVEVTNDGVFQPGLYKDKDGRRRGLGLPLIVSLADQVHVSRLGDAATRVSLTFFLSGGSAAVPTTHEGSAPDSATHMSGPPLALWFLLGAFVVAVAVLAPLRQEAIYNPAGVFTAANILFLTLVSLFVSVLAARAYLRDRPPSVLLVGCGTLALGLGALLAAVHAGGPGTNPIPATYNTAALLAGLCYLGAAFWVRPTFEVSRSLRPWVLVASFGGVVILLVILVVLIRTGVWPLYFVQGQGQTTLGSMVARTSALLFAVSAVAIMFAPGAVDVGLRQPSVFLRSFWIRYSTFQKGFSKTTWPSSHYGLPPKARPPHRISIPIPRRSF